MRRQKVGVCCENSVSLWGDFRECNELSMSDFSLIKTLLADRRFRGWISVRNHLPDPEAVVFEYLVSSFFLHDMMFGLSSPADNRLFVTPGRMRKYPSRPQLAFEALVVDEAVNC